MPLNASLQAEGEWCAGSAADAHQKAPMVRPGLWASMMGMEPYRPNGELVLYSNTSKLYSL